MKPQHVTSRQAPIPASVAAGFQPAENGWRSCGRPAAAAPVLGFPISAFCRRHAGLALVAAATLAAGCKSDLNQQLLERELRYQEDQIYQLQDELAEKCARLNHVAGENASLRQQLGVSDADPAAPSRGRRPRSPGVPPAATVPPAIRVPDAAPLPAPRGGPAPRDGGPPVDVAPPTLEGVPPLPTTDSGESLSLPPATASFDPSARPIAEAGSESRVDPAAAEAPAPALVRMSYDEPAEGGEAVRLAINPSASNGLDADGDGLSEGLSLAIEPRNQGEKLVGLSGDVTITAYDAAAASGSPPLARWTVTVAEAATRFRPTGRRRGLVLDLPWQGTLPAAGHVRVTVESPAASGPLATEALVPVR
jgi:hypothetical protein